MVELLFHNSIHYLKPLLDDSENSSTNNNKKNESTPSLLKVLGQPLIIRNIHILNSALSIKTIKIPNRFPDVLQLIQDNFPSINVEGFSDNDNNKTDYGDGSSTSSSRNNANDNNNNNNNNYNVKGYDYSVITSSANNKIIIPVDNKTNNNNNSSSNSSSTIKLPINSLIHYSSYKSNNNNNNNNSLTIDSIIYPWDFLNAVKRVLHDEVKQKTISPSASVAKSSIIDGPCIIEDNVIVDDFCKIKGPIYIGKDSSIGTASLIRNCMIGSKTKVGFNCEISNAYLKGDDEIAHLNVIGESIIGENVWFGGYSVTSNMLLTRQNIRYDIGNGKPVDTGTHRFGAVVGNNCVIGTSVIILPGKQVVANRVINDGTVFAK